jgi:phospholipase C
VNPLQQSDDPIRHVLVLMFENHSFDQMLGCFKQVYPGLEGIDPKASPNVNKDDEGRPFPQAETRERQMILDPRHEVEHVAAQLQDNNGGFVKDLIAANQKDTKLTKNLLDEQCHFVMGYYPLDFLPALHRLAREFLICDHWFSSVPGPTWVNRFFALTGTSLGRVNMPEDGKHKVDFAGWFQQDQTTIFDRLTEKGVSWKVYFHDIPQTVCLTHQRLPENAARYFPFGEFLKDALGREAEFPAFSFIEPDYNGVTENDDHPPHDIMKAQKLLADVYNALRSNEDLWNSTLLVVVYDEHGGFYDHVPPAAATPPDDHHEEYTFDRLGVRVPALLVSPWVEPGYNSTVFDHTSLLKYLKDKWKLNDLGKRVDKANSIALALKHGKLRTGAPDWITLSADQLLPPDPDREEDAVAYLSSHHRALAKIGEHLMAEFDEGAPGIYARLSRFYLAIKGLFLSKPTTPEAILQDYAKAKENCLKFFAERKKQAVPKLAATIRDRNIHPCVRHHAAETLGYAVNQRLHREPDPAAAAEHWLDRHGH